MDQKISYDDCFVQASILIGPEENGNSTVTEITLGGCGVAASTAGEAVTIRFYGSLERQSLIKALRLMADSLAC